MKRNFLIPILPAVLGVCVAAGVLVYFLLKADVSQQEDPKDPVTAELEALLDRADQMILSGEVITKSNHEYLVHVVNACARYYPDAFSYTDETFCIDTAKLDIDLAPIADPKENDETYEAWVKQYVVRYLLLLTQIIEQTPPNRLYMQGALISPSPNLSPDAILHICPDYKAFGYESAEAFVRKAKSGEHSYPYYSLVLTNCRIEHYLYEGDFYLELTS